MPGKRLNPLSVFLAAPLLFISPAEAGWRDKPAPYDIQRIDHLEQARADVLREIGNVPDARAVLNRPSRPVSIEKLAGNWRCRTLKLGGMARNVTYDWFTCRIRLHKGVATFEKRSGTQHLGGMLYPHESGGYVLLGGMNWSGDKPARYSGGRPSLGAKTTSSDVVGMLSSIGPNTARLEFPDPAQESQFDVIELRR